MELEKNVRQEILEGWEPQGGIASAMGKGNIFDGQRRSSHDPNLVSCFYQAMIKEIKS